MKKSLWLVAALAASVSAGALAQGGKAKAKTSGSENVTHCLKAESGGKKDRMMIQNKAA